MFKPLIRADKTSQLPNAGFAETTFLHSAGDDDYSGFAPTQLSEYEDDVAPPVPASAEAARAAASTSHTALERAASAALPVHADEEPSIPQSWVTSQWVAAQEAKAHEAANQARAVIAAQRRADEEAEAAHAHEAALATPKSGLARLRAAFERLLPGGLLPLFLGVTVTMTLISAVLPLVDRL
jgi:hypothetical protein